MILVFYDYAVVCLFLTMQSCANAESKKNINRRSAVKCYWIVEKLALMVFLMILLVII